MRNTELSVVAPQDVEQAFRREELDGELKITRVALFLSLIGIGFSLVTGAALDLSLGFYLVLVACGYLAYYTTSLRLLRRGWYRPWLKFLTSTLEVSCATIIAIIDVVHVSPEYALTSAPPFIYLLAIAATTLRFDRRLSIYAGSLAALQSAGLYFAVSSSLDASLVERLPSIGPVVFLQRSGYLFCGGLMAAATSRTARRLVFSVVTELEKRRYLRWIFGRYVSDDVATRVINGLDTDGELRQVSVLCTDVRGFSKYSSEHAPAEVLEFLNELFEEQCEIVTRNGGRVDKFLGDGMLAIFGDPVELENHALAAARAALDIASLGPNHIPNAPPDLRLGAAVHSGDVMVGNLGSRDRFEYTVIGDTVNIAFRIEGLNRPFATSALVSAATAKLLADAAELVPQEPRKVHGITEPVQTYELLRLRDDEG